MKKHIDGTSLEESLDALIEKSQAANQTFEIELVRFSGRSADVRLVDQACFLRVEATRILDGQGQPHERWGRLAGVSGHWQLPASECEMLLMVAQGTEGAPGTGFLFNLGTNPPAKLAAGVSVFDNDDATKAATTGGGFMWKLPSKAWFGLTNDGFTVAFPNGTRLTLSEGGLQLVVVDGLGAIAVVFTLNAQGLSFLGSASSVPTMLVRFDATSGTIHGLGLGMFVAQFVNVLLGLAPTNGVVYVGPTGIAPSGSVLTSP